MEEIIGSQHFDHAGRRPHGVEVKRRQFARRDGAEAKGQMQRAARRGDVVDIARGTGDMELRGVMGKGLCNAHAETSCRLVARPLASWK